MVSLEQIYQALDVDAYAVSFMIGGASKLECIKIIRANFVGSAKDSLLDSKRLVDQACHEVVWIGKNMKKSAAAHLTEELNRIGADANMWCYLERTDKR